MQHLEIAPGQEFNAFCARLPEWRGWLASLVVDGAGNYTGPDGSSKSISNAVDLQLLLALRSKCQLIVTTGQTARAENYRSSNFAPIGFLTRNHDGLIHLPAFQNPGPFENIILDSQSTVVNFYKLEKELSDRGFRSLLFEGGISSLSQLIQTGKRCQLVFSISNRDDLDVSHATLLLSKVIPTEHKPQLVDSFVSGPNLVTRWVYSSE